MINRERFNRHLEVPSSQSPTLEEVIDELRSSWQEPTETVSESVRRVISLANRGILSDDEEYTLLRYLVADLIGSKVNSMLFGTEFYPFVSRWHPTMEPRRRLRSTPVAGFLHT